MSRRSSLAAAALLALLSSAPARAQNGPSHPAIDAQALHDRAVAALAQRRYDAACPMLEDVARLLPDSLAAQILVAECHLRAGRLATALRRYVLLEGAAAASDRARAAQAHARAEALRPRVSELSLDVPAEVRALPGLQIRVGGAALDPARLDVPQPLDRGTYKIEVTAPGREALVGTLQIDRNGERAVLPVGMPPLLALPPPPPRPPEPAAPPGPAPGSPIPGIVALSAGATALGIATVTGVAALRAGKNAGQEATALATVATAELVAGAAVAAAGVVLLVVKPFGRPEAALAVGPGSVSLVGTF